jgi:hypothetical protein
MPERTPAVAGRSARTGRVGDRVSGGRDRADGGLDRARLAVDLDRDVRARGETRDGVLVHGGHDLQPARAVDLDERRPWHHHVAHVRGPRGQVACERRTQQRVAERLARRRGPRACRGRPGVRLLGLAWRGGATGQQRRRARPVRLRGLAVRLGGRERGAQRAILDARDHRA